MLLYGKESELIAVLKSHLLPRIENNLPHLSRNVYTVKPLLNGHPRGYGLWPLKRGWLFNGSRNNIIAIIGTFIAGRLIEWPFNTWPLNRGLTVFCVTLTDTQISNPVLLGVSANWMFEAFLSVSTHQAKT